MINIKRLDPNLLMKAKTHLKNMKNYGTKSEILLDQ